MKLEIHNRRSIQFNSIQFNSIQFNFVSRMSEISGSASKEYSLEKAMEKMKSEWSDMLFEFTPYRDSVSLL